MQKITIFFLLCCWLSHADAQQLRPDVLASAGTSLVNASNTARLSFTIGEVAIQGRAFPSYSYGQGFHNSAGQGVSAVEAGLEAWNIQVWPNPARDLIFLEFTVPSSKAYLMASVWNLLGQPVIAERVMTENTVQSLTLGHLPAGVYQLRLRDESGRVASYKFVKAD
jgi:Secretion system C-terminal sorting domain